jgi:hypothetical protein
MKSRTLPEWLCHWGYVMTWPFYAVGALYLVGPVLAWLLVALAALSAYLGPAIRRDLALAGPVPPIVWSWIAGMLVMLIALWAGHMNWNLGTGQTIKSTIGWAKGWALIPAFMVAGAVLQIGRDTLIRGQSIVGLCTLLLLPLFLAAPMIGLPPRLFVSPLQATGGPGPEYFSVYLYTIDPESFTPRWQFFAPWSPFAGLIGVTMAIFALEDRSRFWKTCGLTAAVAMILLSKSRMSFVGLAACILIPRLLPLIRYTWMWWVLTAAASALAIVGSSLATTMLDAVHKFKQARADSSRVRDTLQSIAFDRWQAEAVWFGHGTVTRGPHLVEYMPIGSHHTWYGLLYVKGLVGFLALLVPMALHLLATLIDAIRSSRGRLPFALMLNFLILTFGENLEIEVYLLWPALVMLGIHAREMAGDNLRR